MGGAFDSNAEGRRRVHACMVDHPSEIHRWRCIHPSQGLSSSTLKWLRRVGDGFTGCRFGDIGPRQFFTADALGCNRFNQPSPPSNGKYCA